MKKLLDWIDDRTGWWTFWRGWLERPVPAAPAWQFVWPTTIVFTFLTQAITGVVLWMYYSPSGADGLGERVLPPVPGAGGWLLRAIHHYAGQVMLVLVGLYLLQMIVRGAYRAPRELLFWSVVLMGLVTLALNLTGDLLPWDQNSYWATHVRTGFLLLLPWDRRAAVPAGRRRSGFRPPHAHSVPGPARRRLLQPLRGPVGGTRMAGAALRDGICSSEYLSPEPYWPVQAKRDAVACAAVLAVILALSFQHGVTGEHAGVALGAPANPVEDPHTARPEWSFRGLFQFRELFPSHLEILPIFVLSGLTVLIVFLAPFIAGKPGGYLLNVAFILFVPAGLAVLSWQSYFHDAQNEEFQRASAAGNAEADRVRELARGEGIPVDGALGLLLRDPKSQGPRLFARFCTACHDYSQPEDGSLRNASPTAPDLAGFASREWLRGLFDPKQIAGPKYFGNTKFAKGDMVGFVRESVVDFDKEDIDKMIKALSAEAGLESQSGLDADDDADIVKGRALIRDDLGCTDCHKFHGKGLAKGPDLTGYGSHRWLTGIIGNPNGRGFYVKSDKYPMPAYAASDDPGKNTLSAVEMKLLVDWMRGEWYEPEEEEPGDTE